MIDLVDEVASSASASARTALMSSFSTAWGERRPAAGAALDHLARAAATSPPALDVLLALA